MANSFPPSWPVYTPAHKLAGWLEYYAEALELNVWTNTEAENVKLLDNGKYEVVVRKGDGSRRTFIVDHVIMALGFGGGVPKWPSIPGQVSIAAVRTIDHGLTAFRTGGVPGSGSSLDSAQVGKGPHREEGCHHRSMHLRRVL